MKVSKDSQDVPYSIPDDLFVLFIVEVNSAFGAEDMLKLRMYQEEQRYSSQQAA